MRWTAGALVGVVPFEMMVYAEGHGYMTVDEAKGIYVSIKIKGVDELFSAAEDAVNALPIDSRCSYGHELLLRDVEPHHAVLHSCSCGCV